MVQRDYILRLIEQFGQALGMALALRRERKYGEAVNVLDDSLQRLLGLNLATITAFPAEELVALIRAMRAGNQGRQATADRLAVVAAALQEEAEIYADQGDQERAAARRVKALHIHLAVLTGEDPESAQAKTHVDRLLEQLTAYDLPETDKEMLWRVYEGAGEYARAEDWLFELLEDGNDRKQIIESGIVFYERLLTRSDADLARGSLPRDEVEAGLAQLRSMLGDSSSP